MNRRRMLAGGAAALPLVLAGAVAVANAATGDDAELVRLGAEFDRLYEDWKPLWREMRRESDAFHTFAQAGKFADYMAAYRTPEGRRCEAAARRNNRQLDRVEAMANRIRAIQPVSLVGLAVRARVCRFDACLLPKIEKPREHWEWDTLCLQDFLADIERMAGKAVQS